MSLPTRPEAIDLLHRYIQGDYLRRHSLATEAIMRALAPRFGAGLDLWGITGLLHDLDLEQVGDDASRHARVTVEILSELSYPEEGLQAILAHNGDVLGIACATPFDHALVASESITGMVFAMALILPSRRVSEVKPKSVAKRMKEPRFAANVSRERIAHHEKLGVDLLTFCSIAVEAMRSLGDDIA